MLEEEEERRKKLTWKSQFHKIAVLVIDESLTVVTIVITTMVLTSLVVTCMRSPIWIVERGSNLGSSSSLPFVLPSEVLCLLELVLLAG